MGTWEFCRLGMLRGSCVCVLREWVGLDGYFWIQGLSVGMQECLERFHRGCVDYLNRQVISKSDSPNCERELATNWQVICLPFGCGNNLFSLCI